MSVLFFLIPLSFLFAGIGVVAFIVAIKSGQLDDLDSPAQRLVFEDKVIAIASREDANESGK